jgi:hypothetical protein
MILSECPGYGGNAGGEGRIKILSSTASPSVTGSLTGVVSEGLLPPIPVTSTSHPNPSITYNDDFPSFDFSWSQPFTGTQGYYVLGATAAMVPTPANAQFVSTDYVSLPSTTIMSPPPSYTLLFQITPVTASSTVGTIETTFPVQINTVPPTLTSSSHPTQTAWSANVNPYFSWTYPVPAASVVATYYVFDHMGDTVPTTADTKLPASQTSLLLSNVADGIWVMHILAQDPAGYLTHAASSYRVNIGPNPGTGSLSGAVVNAMSQPAPNVTVSLNGGLYTTTTNSMGVYNFMNVPAVTWQVSATSGTMTATGTGTVTSGGSTTTNLML